MLGEAILQWVDLCPMRNGIHAALSCVLALGLFACGSAGATDDAASDESTASADPTQTLDNAAVNGTTPTSAKTGADPVVTADPTNPAAPSDPSNPAAPSPPSTPPTSSNNPGPKPTTTCSVSKDANGFFTRNGYVGYVPPTYDGTKAVRLVVGIHGCGDNALNFATWAVAPYDTRKTQQHIAISIGGRDGACWQNSDETAVMNAIADISSCFWVHQQEVVIAGYSSGGELGYRVAMKHADKIAGLLIEDSGFYGSSDEATLLANAAHKLPIAHITHQSDTVFPLATVQADWTKIKNAGFPMTTSVIAGTHNGTGADWSTFLLPHAASMKLP